MAKTRLAKVVLTIKGVWSPTVEYEKLDIVNYLGSSYIAKRDNIGVTPVEGDDWSLSAEKGGKGDQGDKIYLHIAYANSEDGETDFTTSPVSDKVYTYLGSYSDYTPEDSNVPSTYVWSKLTEEAERAAAELLRVAAEEERVAAETARVSAESQRDRAESSRNTAEETRVSNEQSRVSAETNRVSEESARQSAETARVSSETDRQEAEVSRLDEEKRRVSAETDRVNAETNRIEGEQHRVSAEQSRETAETDRVSNESARNTAEETRVSDESARKTAETSRVSAENTRDTSETKRVNAEISRSTAETARVNAEDMRVLAEQGRVSAESGRVSAEQGRVSAETERVTAETERAATFSGYQNEIAQFKTEIVTSKDAATENTKFAIGKAEQTLEVPSMEEINAVKDDVAAITPDDNSVDGKPWASKKTVDSLCMPIEETGNPVQVYPVEGYPLGVKVSWEPTQEGSGDPSPDNIRPIVGWDSVTVTRCGKNLLDFSNAYVAGYNISGFNNFLKPNTTYSFRVNKSNGIDFAVFIGNHPVAGSPAYKDKRITSTYINEGVTDIFTTPEDMSEYPYLLLCGIKYGIDSVFPDVEFQIEIGSTPTAYEPYTGSTMDIALPEMVYGGEVDVDTGEGQETWKMLTLDGTEEWKRSNNYCEVAYRDLGIPSSTNIIESAKLSQYADRYIIDNAYTNTSADKCAWVFSTTMYPHANLRIKHEAEQSTLENWKAYLAAQYAAGTPVQICYKLAEPVPFTATGTQPILALSGANTVYTDADSVVVTGAEDPKHTITELKNAIISLGGNV